MYRDAVTFGLISVAFRSAKARSFAERKATKLSTTHHSPLTTHRPAFTLVELLIVVAIMVVLAAFLIPAIKPALADRKVREAARMTNLFFAQAQARAVENGRPVGVWIERNPNSPNEAMQLFMAEVPLPYAGDTINAKTQIKFDSNHPVTGEPIYRAEFDSNSASIEFLVQTGDQIKFNYNGPRYTIIPGIPTNPNSPGVTPAIPPPPAPPTTPANVKFLRNSGRAPQLTGPAGVPYQITRRPGRSSATTFALPSTTSINLHYSGAGAAGFNQMATGGFGASSASDTSPILIMFGPNGGLERIYVQGTNVQATESVYLFVARNDKQAADGSTNIVGPQNLADMSNLWIAVGHRTGSIATVETSPAPNGQPAATAFDARRFAREKTSMGGR